jgi:hypothetical protein
MKKKKKLNPTSLAFKQAHSSQHNKMKKGKKKSSGQIHGKY